MIAGTPTLEGPAAIAAADAVVAELIAAAKSGGDRARLTKAPAGAGKTGAVTRLVDALADNGANVGVIAQTNAQAFDLVDRIARLTPARTVVFMPATDIVLPPAIAALPNVEARAADHLGVAPVVVATADKWGYAAPRLGGGRFDAGVIDEGYQMPSSKLLRIADTFPTLDFLGDPGQLDPFSTVDDARWRGLAVNPVLNAVDVLLANRGDEVPVRALPLTRRLPPSAAGVINEIFYPDLRFGPGSVSSDRELMYTRKVVGGSPVVRDAWRSAVSRGWAYVELPHRIVVQPDLEIVGLIGDLVEWFFATDPAVRDERHQGRTLDVDEGRVAVGVAHRNQRAALQIELQRRGLPDVVVDTANRLQGREFDVFGRLASARRTPGRHGVSSRCWARCGPHDPPPPCVRRRRSGRRPTAAGGSSASWRLRLGDRAPGRVRRVGGTRPPDRSPRVRAGRRMRRAVTERSRTTPAIARSPFKARRHDTPIDLAYDARA